MTTLAEPARVETSLWRPMIVGMGKTGVASVASGIFSALGTKIIAAQLGPSSIALLATLQQLRDGAVNAATANGKTALVQGASALEGIERREYVRSVALLFAGTTLLVAGAIWIAPQSIARWSRLPAGNETLLRWLAATIALLSGFVFVTAILNACRDLGRLALVQLTSPLVAALVAWPLTIEFRAGHTWALGLFLAIPAGAAAIFAAVALKGHLLHEWFQGSGRWWSSAAARHFLSLSGAMLVSGLAATSVLLAVRGSITRQQGLAVTGQFDAAWNISMNQVTLILGSVQAYYLPTLAAAKSAGERGRQIRGMLMVATLATVPVIVAITALKPLVVNAFYSSQFTSSPTYLRWTLIGDYLKVSSWVLATPMLATRDVGAFLGSDLIAHATFWGSAIFLSRIANPAESAAIGFSISCAVYFALSLGYARTRHGFRFGAAGLSLWFTGLMLIMGASASAWSDTTIRLANAAFWIVLALGFSVGSAFYFRGREA